MPKKTKPEAILAMEAPAQPYSPCVQIGDHFHFSGVVAVDEHKQPDGDAKDQIVKVLGKMIDLLIACDLSTNDVYSTTVLFAGDMKNFAYLNDRWNIAFGPCKIKPRRKAFAVAALPFGCAVEIEFDAVRQSE